MQEVRPRAIDLIEVQRFGQAAYALQSLIRRAAPIYGSRSPEILETRLDYGAVLMLVGDYRAALTVFEELITDLTARYDLDHDSVRECRQQVSTCQAELGEGTVALRTLRDLLDASTGPDRLALRHQIAVITAGIGRVASARGHLDFTLAGHSLGPRPGFRAGRGDPGPDRTPATPVRRQLKFLPQCWGRRRRWERPAGRAFSLNKRDVSIAGKSCPSVWLDEERRDLAVHDWEVAGTVELAVLGTANPMEPIVRLPAGMRSLIQEAPAMAVPTFEELLRNCTRQAAHLEMRDGYSRQDPIFLDWLAGREIDPVQHERDWFETATEAVDRGVAIRRARIVSEPLSEWILHEYETTPKLNLKAGEEVRWLPRRQASDLALPGNDFWLFDDRIVRFGYFAGDGDYVGDEVVQDPVVVSLCRDAFAAVWERAVDHSDYRPGHRGTSTPS